MLGYSNIAIHANHMDMARFSDKSAQGYEHVSGVILGSMGWVEFLSQKAHEKRYPGVPLGVNSRKCT